MKLSQAVIITSVYWVTHWQTITKLKFWISTSPSSEVIVDTKFKVLAFGLRKTLLKVIEDVLPVNVILFPSAGLVAIIDIPPLKLLDIKKVPKRNPEFTSIDSTTTWDEEITELTSKSVVKALGPAESEAEPIVSPTLMLESVKDPPSETKRAVSISTS